MKLRALAIFLASLWAGPLVGAETPRQEIVVMVGAVGEDEFAGGFAAAAKAWQKAAGEAGANITVFGLDPEVEKGPTDRDRLYDWTQKIDPNSTVPAWIVYIGHGTFDGREARMNFRGPDVSAADLASWLKNVKRPLIVVDGSSASGPFLVSLSAPNRIIMAGTQSGREVNYTRFGEKFAEAIVKPDSDIDQDGQISLLEAFITASQATQDFYTESNRMASEHSLIDDNGDKRGTPFDWFQGTRLVRRAQGNAAPDGEWARLVTLSPSAAERAFTPEQLALRAQYEKDLAGLRNRKATMGEAEYYAALEGILRKLGELYLKPGGAAALAGEVPPVAVTAPATKDNREVLLAPPPVPVAAPATGPGDRRGGPGGPGGPAGPGGPQRGGRRGQ